MSNDNPITRAEAEAIITVTEKMAGAMANTGAAVSALAASQAESKTANAAAHAKLEDKLNEQAKGIGEINSKATVCIVIMSLILALAGVLEIINLVTRK